MKRHILFVDDEPNLLRGLRRSLFHLQDAWDMEFADSSQAALDLLEQTPFDVIVSDLKMPGMDGVKLLEEVRARQPGVVRILLSGYSDRTQLTHSAKLAHQFLTKPCPPAVIQETVERVLALKDIFLNDVIRNAITSLESLPLMSETYNELIRLTSSESTGLDEVTRLIIRDMGMTASVLKLVNSSFFGLPRRITDPAHAVALLGIDIIRSLALTDQLFAKFDASRYPEFNMDNLWRHSQCTALFAKTIARLEKAESKAVEMSYICGLLHDVGKLVLADAFEPEYRKIIALANQRNQPIVEVESETIRVTHAEMGAYLLGLWGFAEPVVRAVATHHDPTSGQDHFHNMVLHAANSLEHELAVFNSNYAPHPVSAAYLKQAGLVERYGLWREACKQLLVEQ